MTNQRPPLTKELNSTTFREYYYLKEELIQFCRLHGLPTSGGKLELTDRIAHYLDTGILLMPRKQTKKTTKIKEITLDSLIETPFTCSEVHRAFFREQIGKTFSFNVAFQTWLKANAGYTYQDAIAAYNQIIEDQKKGKTTIDRQFEYNTYIRDFFAHNKGMSLEDAIKCWKYKRSQPGHHRYEDRDLIALT